MHHDKKTALHHQNILIRRGFNLPAVPAPGDAAEAETKKAGTQKVKAKQKIDKKAPGTTGTEIK